MLRRPREPALLVKSVGIAGRSSTSRTVCRRALFALTVALCSSQAWAKFEYPFGQRLLVAPNEPDRLWLRTSYGFLTSADRGQTWGWSCSESAGTVDDERPALGIAANGVLLVGSLQGLASSTDRSRRDSDAAAATR